LKGADERSPSRLLLAFLINPQCSMEDASCLG
jgi:hypothetical protein